MKILPMLQRAFAATLLCLSLALPANAQDAPYNQNPDALDFMLGIWHTVGGIPQEDGSYTRSSGIHVGERAFNGGTTPSIQVRTYTLPRSQGNDNPFDIAYFEDMSIYVFHPGRQQWTGVSHNTLGNRKWRDFIQAHEEVVFMQRGELFQGVTGDIRFTYYDITETSFQMRVDFRPSEDADWIVGTYRMTATRAG